MGLAVRERGGLGECTLLLLGAPGVGYADDAYDGDAVVVRVCCYW